MGKRVFVTVGTTKFDKLIQTVLQTDVLEFLKDLGFTELQCQVGTGVFTEKTHDGLNIFYDSYIEDFDKQLEISDLIISHAGAGTCLEILKKGKPAIVVINEDLMDNHQIELAEKLQEEGFLYYCTCSTLKKCLGNDFDDLKKYPKADRGVFSNYLDKCMGFI